MSVPVASSLGSTAGATVVWLSGEHDISTDASLWRHLSEVVASSDGPVVADLSKVTFMGASTLGVLVAARNLLLGKSRAFTVRSPSACVRRAIRICNLDEILGVAQSVDAAAGADPAWVTSGPGSVLGAGAPGTRASRVLACAPSGGAEWEEAGGHD